MAQTHLTRIRTRRALLHLGLGLGLAATGPLLALGLVGTQACSELTLTGPDAGILTSLLVLPGDTKLQLSGDKVVTKTYFACAAFTDSALRDATISDKTGGSTVCPAGTQDVSAQAEWSVEPSTLGRFQGSQFRTETDTNGTLHAAYHGGKGAIQARYGALSATATVQIDYQKDFIDTGAPKDAASKFGGASSGTITFYYPPENVLVPPNLGQIDVQISAPSTTDLYLLEFKSATSTVRIYTTNKKYALTIPQWQAVGMTSAGLNVTLTVKGVKSTGGPVAKSGARTLRIGESAVKGGLYYWVVEKPASASAPKYGHIYRYDFDKPKEKAEAYYTYQEAKDCVGCHALSRGGDYLAFTLSGGNGDGAIFDVKQKTALFDTRTYKADIHTFNPDGTEVIVVNQGVLTRRESKTGKLLETIPTGTGKSTHPDWSPKDDSLVFVRCADKDYWAGGIKDDVHFVNGSVYIMNRQGGKWGTPKLLVQGGGNVNNYYPTFSPNGDWILYNRSTGDSYSDADANIYAIKPDGTKQIELKGINGLNNSNSWPRWSPFVQKYRTTTLYWLTFSSVRNYGIRLLNSNVSYYPDKVPQIWMTSFDVEAAEKKLDPTSPPFWLPFQDMTKHNHIAQWTQKVVSLY